jgi:D-3-phosphoglycerate dehydrogenase
MDIVRGVASIKVLRDQYPPVSPISEAEVLEAIADVDALVNVRYVTISRGIIEAARKLKLIARHGLGYECIDVEAATRQNILVTRAIGEGSHPVAEHTIGFLVALSRRLIAADTSVKAGKWETYKFAGIELRNKTLGIIGLGGIGSEVARMASLALQMKVIAYSPHVSAEKASDIGVKLVDLHSLLRESDYISIHAALTEENVGLLGREEFDLMKEAVFIINCARGPIIDEKALYAALVSGKVAGAALDVLAEEPPRDNPILKLENVIVTPHIAGFTGAAAERLAISVAEDVTNVLKDRLPELERIVNKSILDAPPWNKMR